MVQEDEANGDDQDVGQGGEVGKAVRALSPGGAKWTQNFEKDSVTKKEDAITRKKAEGNRNMKEIIPERVERLRNVDTRKHVEKMDAIRNARPHVEEKFEKYFGYLARCEGNFCI